ncbi:hypothetical protein LTR36_008982 [Oleoguttula mirabilis]|uniref:Dicer-like protein 2 n=1 Tax=Oleoguttula mirabilis TaxID=1507867 RepID=A0AAV9J6Q0_9PEZI|nr:hypothetical protein LTR36_008982 [Oleoguttula mirabilis]
MPIDNAANTATDVEPELKLRSYQQEMLDASLKRNVIMDTGSGKTHIAIARILAELERAEPSKLVWFMCPSVALSEQQHSAIQPYLSAYQVLMLTGKDGVDKWTDQKLWDATLSNVRVVVGTPAVLADALTHGFVRMSRLALLVFDEAHRCIKDSPMNQIMKNFYHPSKSRAQAIPHILGLSASPVMSTKEGSLRTIEANLDAITTTPKQERMELGRYVHPPQITTTLFQASPSFERPSSSQVCDALSSAAEQYNFGKDPYLLELKQHDDGRSRKQLEQAILKRKTYCSEQLRVLCRKATALYEQLGPPAAEWYIISYIARFKDSSHGDMVLPDVTAKEQQHLMGHFNAIAGTATNKTSLPTVRGLSDKANTLMSLLAQQASPSLRGIIFVEQRAAVSTLAHLLRSTPHIAANYNVGTFVGTSSFGSRKSSIADLAEAWQQQRDLDDFRSGSKNLMIATNVLEEGIDVSACNLVVCFDLPSTLVSFVQRRGRARQKGSTYYLFISEDDWKTDALKWQKQEAEMKQAYMDDLRTQEPTVSEDEDAVNTRTYRIESTAALLTLDNAKAHLYHVCAVSTLQVSNYVDVRPEFFPEKRFGDKPWTATVTLPSFVHPDLRTASSSTAWRTEDAAIKDAAFEAYVALHKAGLVNDNLLPLIKDHGPAGLEHVDRPAIISVAERQTPWTRLFGSDLCGQWYATTVTVTQDSQVVVRMEMYIPAALAQGGSFPLYWNERLTYTVSYGATSRAQRPDNQKLLSLQQCTSLLLTAVHGNRVSTQQSDFAVLFRPKQASSTMPQWLSLSTGCLPASEYFGRDVQSQECGLVHVKTQPGRAFIFRRFVPTCTFTDSVQPGIAVTGFPKRRDFLHPVPERQEVNAAYTAEQTFAMTECMVDNLPLPYALFAAFAPSLMHRIDIQLLAQHLQTTVLKDINIGNTSLVIEAISASSSGEAADYNRLEYLGDTVLKFCVHLQVTAQHQTWPEGYLSMEKYRLVRNSTLTKAALEAGLDQYILTKAFTGSKWRPLYISEVLAADSNAAREVSSKVLADVVEALIGAALVDGGLGKAYQCIRTLLPLETWYPESEIFSRLTSDLSPCSHSSLDLLEQLIGHHFAHPTLLVEAVTHVSLPLQRTGMSYERLEFLGDSVLDLIIVPKLFAHTRRLKHWQMHNVHEALVNGIFLGYCCMDYGIEQDKYAVVETGAGRLGVERLAKLLHLHDFIRASGQVVRAKQASLDTYERLRRPVKAALRDGKEYPWCDLLAMSPHKFFSDLIEAVLGALYVDTHGDVSVCEAFVEKLGIMKHMRTMLDTQMQTMSPKERLGVAAGSSAVQYSVVSSAVGEDKSRLTFSCTVEVGGQEVALVRDCANKAEAEARAALAAVEALRVKLGATATATESKRKRNPDVAACEDGHMREKSAVCDADAMQVDSPPSECSGDGGVGLTQ